MVINQLAIIITHHNWTQVIVKIATPEMKEVKELDETPRGKRGFGSSGVSEIGSEKLSK